MRMARGFACGALAFLCLGFVPPNRDALPEIVGVYQAVGTHPDGTGYSGKGTITRLGGERYALVFDMPNGVFRALCLRVRDVLGCAWGEGDLTVAMWRPSALGLEGWWTRDGASGIARELGPVADPFAGPARLSGVSLDGASYEGDTHATSVGAFHRVDWRKPEQTTGWGLRVGSTLVAAFPAAGTGVAYYRIARSGSELSGEWTDLDPSSTTVGTETLTR